MKGGRCVEERVHTTYRRLLLIEAAMLAPPDCLGDRKGLRAAIAELAWEACLDLKPLLEAPGEIGSWEPPEPQDGQ